VFGRDKYEYKMGLRWDFIITKTITKKKLGK
jgi:hypothetical protein